MTQGPYVNTIYHTELSLQGCFRASEAWKEPYLHTQGPHCSSSSNSSVSFLFIYFFLLPFLKAAPPHFSFINSVTLFSLLSNLRGHFSLVLSVFFLSNSFNKI